MPSCTTCGAFTKYVNGKCQSCFYGGKSKAGKVYIAKVGFSNGKSTIYTGQTKRSVYERIGEHMGYQRNGERRHYTGRGSSISLLGSIFSTNRFKAEKTIKGLPREDKEALARKGAENYKKKKRKWLW